MEAADDFSPDWWALVGPPARPNPGGVILVPHDRTRVLAAPAVIGPLHVRSGERRLVEYVRDEPWSLDGYSIVETHPVIVEGKWDGVLTETDLELAVTPEGGRTGIRERAAARALHRLVCLISLAWGEPWQVRTSPREVSSLPPRVPDSWPQPPPAVPDDDELPENTTELPAWVQAAWPVVDDDQALRSALSFWHQGVMLNTEFPSFALVAFTAAVESLAKAVAFADELKQVQADACSTCGNVPKAARRFWATLELGANVEELARLKHAEIYVGRSDVAHGAQMLGAETAWGPVHLLLYRVDAEGGGPRVELDRSDSTQVFALEMLPTVRAIAARLIRRALGTSTTA